MKYKKILIVYKKPLLEIYRDKHADLEKLVMEEGLDIKDLEAEFNEDKAARKVVKETLEKDKDVKADWIYRAHLSKDLIKKYDLIIPFGGDGTLIDASHYINDKPVFGVNSDYRPEDPDSSEGFYLAANKHDFPEKYKNLQQGKLKEYKFNRLQLELNGKKLEELVLNDALVIHKHPAATSRMVVKDKSIEEFQKTDGLIIATAASNWAISYGGKVLPITSKKISYVTKGLYVGKLNPNPKLRTGVTKNLEVFSKMREGKLYVDGKHIEYDFGLGVKLKVYSGKPLTIIGFDESKRERYYASVDREVNPRISVYYSEPNYYVEISKKYITNPKKIIEECKDSPLLMDKDPNLCFYPSYEGLKNGYHRFCAPTSEGVGVLIEEIEDLLS